MELVLPFGMFAEIRDYLFSDPSKEYACYLLCGHATSGKTLRLLGCYLVTPDPTEYESHSLVSVRVQRQLLIEVLKECERHNLSLIDIHSHPFASQSVAFSGVDEADEREKAQWFAEHLPRSFYGSVVLGTHCHKARIRSAAGALIEADLPIRNIQAPLFGRENFANQTAENDRPFNRHISAFGVDGQKRLASAHFGIVGIGGLGAGLAISLARLGARRFTLIDPDHVEIHNLNRVSGMTLADAKQGLKKVDVVARELRKIDPKIKCRLIAKSVLERPAWRALLTTDLIITATDNHASRLLLNVLSQQYLVPQVSIGTLIDTKEGKIEGGYGHVGVLLPGHRRPCLLCSKVINPIEAYYETAPEAHRREAAKRGYIANFDEPAPSVVHLNGVLVNLGLVEIHNLFSFFKEPAYQLQYDMFEQEVLRVFEGEQQCATCSPGGGTFGRGDLVPLDDIFKELAPK